MDSGPATQRAADRLLLSLSKPTQYADAQGWAHRCRALVNSNSGASWVHISKEEDRMKTKLGMLLLLSTAMVAPAAAQQGQPNPNQAAAKAILQAADKAIGASNVKSLTVAATGRIGSPGQQFAQGDLPRADVKSYTFTADYGSKSA